MYNDETTQAERLASLKAHLGSIVFAQVDSVKTEDKHVLSFETVDGFEVLDNEPSFEKERAKLTSEEWKRTRKSYHHYYGFAIDAEGKGIYFDLAAHDRSHRFSTELGIETDQHPLEPPHENDWIVGKLRPPDAKSKGPRFQRWVNCTGEEVIFADLLLGRNTQGVGQLHIRRSEGESDESLVTMARVLVYGHMDFYLAERRRTPSTTDLAVHQVCRLYDMEFWYAYEAKAREQRIYSSLIPAPAPKPIMPGVGIHTPFAGLELKA